MNIKKISLLILIACVLVACDKAPVASSSTDNREIPVDTLFTKDGCTVYRFIDSGYYVYYVQCSNRNSGQTFYQQNCGKGCTRPVHINTTEID